MGGILSTPKTPAAPAPVQVPTREDPEVEEARRRAKVALSKSKGRAATILTGGEGLTGDAPTTKKTLLGE